MKLSHRDFRPPRRSKYVTRPPHRRPTLRILFLGLLGLAVYLKFDVVARFPFWKDFRRPGEWISEHMRRPQPASARNPIVLDWERDSSRVTASCPVDPSSCLGADFPLGREAAGRVREVLGKAEARWQADAKEGFAAGFARSQELGASEASWDLTALELRGAGKPVRLARDPSRGPTAYCAEGRCLDDLDPRPPVAGFRSLRAKSQALPSPDPGLPGPPAPVAVFTAMNGTGVSPILRGRVIALPAPEDSLGWIKLHHGANLFSYYRGLARLGGTVRAGAMLAAGDTLGWLGGDSPAVELRMESDGAALDPLAFLGLQPGAEGSGHGR